MPAATTHFEFVKDAYNLLDENIKEKIRARAQDQ